MTQMNTRKMNKLSFLVCIMLFILKTCSCSDMRHKESLSIVVGMVAGGFASPTYFYETIEDFDDSNEKHDLFMTTHRSEELVPTRGTTEAPIEDEWKQRGEYRIRCVDELGVGPKRVVNLLATANHKWDNTDVDLKHWMLCVLNKMNLMSMEGVFRMDVAMSKIYNKDKEDAEILINHCLPKKKLPPYETAWQYVKCHNAAKSNFAAISVF